MADNATIFSLEAVAGGWFAPEVQGHGWFDRNQLDPPGAGGVDATASGATVSEVYSLIAGAASGQSNATASGATLTEAYSFIAGAAVGGSGAVDGTASGVTLTEAYSLVAGTVSGQSNATASGVTLTEAYSLLAGTASGQSNATASGATVSEVYSFLPGAASAGVSAVANGATVQNVYSFIGGSTLGESLPLSGGGAGGAYRKRLTVKQERKLDEAIADLLELETTVKQARTPRVREKKLQKAVSIAKSIQDEIQTELPQFAVAKLDLSNFIYTLRSMLDGALNFSMQREALQRELYNIRLAAQSMQQRDDDDMLLLLMLAA